MTHHLPTPSIPAADSIRCDVRDQELDIISRDRDACQFRVNTLIRKILQVVMIVRSGSIPGSLRLLTLNSSTRPIVVSSFVAGSPHPNSAFPSARGRAIASFHAHLARVLRRRGGPRTIQDVVQLDKVYDLGDDPLRILTPRSWRIVPLAWGIVAFIAVVVSQSASTFGADLKRPNVVLIVSDDLGYMDIGANNPKTFYETPVIDRLARAGMRFTRGYAACPVCSPTRASIMTGKYPQRTGITDFIGGRRPGKLLPAPNRDHLALEEITIAERFRSEGYSTFFAGKWHLGTGEFSPNAQGFGPGLTGTGQF